MLFAESVLHWGGALEFLVRDSDRRGRRPYSLLTKTKTKRKVLIVSAGTYEL